MKMLLLPLALCLSYACADLLAPAIKLPGYFACTQSMLVPGKDVLSLYAPTQRGCQNGLVVLAYEKRLSSAAEEPRYLIADTVQVNISAAKNYLTIAGCTTARGQSTQYIVLCKHDALGGKYLRSILRVWGVNAQGQL
ncbi:MAG: hypothetical protein EOO60_13765, partial [Hymenobacter sp.]